MILVVDENPDTCAAIGRALEDYGYPTRCTTSATAALGMLELEEAEAIVTNVRTRHRSGVWLLQRADEMHPNTLRILTFQDPRIEGPRLRNHGVCHMYLRGPFGAERLSELLEGAGVCPIPRGPAPEATAS